jgi:hypothetical protein
LRLESVRELKAEIESRLLTPLRRIARHGVAATPARSVGLLPTLALGITPRTRRDYRLAVRVQQQGIVASEPVQEISRLARGEVDVRYIGRVRKLASSPRPLGKEGADYYRRRRRPLIAGCSIGHYEITAGTLGCFVRNARGATRILSNNHVLADENRAKKGDDILQPGRFDGGRRPRDTVGVLDTFVRVKFRGRNQVDAAIATISKGIEFEPPKLTGVAADPAAVVDVAKVGRTTALTRGRIVAFEVDNVVVEYDQGPAVFDGQLEIESSGDGPFSDGGDSGSLIYTDAGLAVGLLFAGSTQGGSNNLGLTYAAPIDDVLQALKCELLT